MTSTRKRKKTTFNSKTAWSSPVFIIYKSDGHHQLQASRLLATNLRQDISFQSASQARPKRKDTAHGTIGNRRPTRPSGARGKRRQGNRSTGERTSPHGQLRLGWAGLDRFDSVFLLLSFLKHSQSLLCFFALLPGTRGTRL